MLARALRVTKEQQLGTRYNVFFPYSNGELSVRLGVVNVAGSLSHLRLAGGDSEQDLDVTTRQVPEHGYAQTLFEHGLIPADRMQEARTLLHEDEPGMLVTVFVPERLEEFRRIVYNTLIVCSQSVHGSARISGQKVPQDAAAVLLDRAKILLPEAQYKRLLADFSHSLADELDEECAGVDDSLRQQLHLEMSQRMRKQAESASLQAAQAEVGPSGLSSEHVRS